MKMSPTRPDVAWRMPLHLSNHGFAWGISIMTLIVMPLLVELSVKYLDGNPPLILSDGDVIHCIPIENLVKKMPTPASGWRKAPTMQPRESPIAVQPTVHSIRPAIPLMAAENRFCQVGTIPSRSRPGMNSYFKRTPGSKAYPKAQSLSVVHLLIAGGAKVRDKAPPVEESLWPEDHDNHKYAVADIMGPFRGTQARLNIWSPHVEEEEFSLAQVWVSSIDLNGKLYTLEAGWQIYRELYSDSKPRLFVYWTADDYRTTGCYNLHCAGFVQVSNRWLLGGSFAAVSTLNSSFQFEIKIQIFKDRGTGDWWLQLNDENVGYWPNSLFGPGAFTDTNTRIDWGGEVWHRRGHYTSTEMGNGNNPASSGVPKKVAYVRNIKVVNYQDYLQDPPKTPTPLSSYSRCCHLIVYDNARGNRSSQSSWGTYAYFGGSGFNRKCVHASSPN